MPDPLNDAITRVSAFRASWSKGNEICECSKLKPEDLDLVLDAARRRAAIETGHPIMPELRDRAE